jgi:Rieske Fe-S protein
VLIVAAFLDDGAPDDDAEWLGVAVVAAAAAAPPLLVALFAAALGALAAFPEGETRLAVYDNPFRVPWDGATAKVACWVRRSKGEQFQVFAINCAHLGCPVRWFPQSNLFMCPCHGGAYYEDGSRASGPPPRGLFQYSYKVEDGRLFIKAGETPTTGSPTALLTIQKRPPCA